MVTGMANDAGKYARFAAIGVEFFSPIVAGTFAGHFLDVYFHTDPWLTLILLLAGVFVAFFRLISELQAAQKMLNK